MTNEIFSSIIELRADFYAQKLLSIYTSRFIAKCILTNLRWCSFYVPEKFIVDSTWCNFKTLSWMTLLKALQRTVFNGNISKLMKEEKQEMKWNHNDDVFHEHRRDRCLRDVATYSLNQSEALQCELKLIFNSFSIDFPSISHRMSFQSFLVKWNGFEAFPTLLVLSRTFIKLLALMFTLDEVSSIVHVESHPKVLL